jgi:hypothetical protein
MVCQVGRVSLVGKMQRLTYRAYPTDLAHQAGT